MKNFYKGGRGLPNRERPITYLKPKLHRSIIAIIDAVKSYNLLLRPAKQGHSALGMSGRYLLLLFSFCLFSNLVVAQEPRKDSGANGQLDIKPLQIGDTIPEGLWNLPLKIVNHPTGRDTITLNDYRDKKLIILDFWATWCVPCVAAIEGNNVLENRFAKEVAIMRITGEPQHALERFFNKRKEQHPFISVYDDKQIRQYFPHTSIPHYVWIADGRLIGETGQEEVKSNNIEMLLLGKKVVLPQKLDIVDYGFDEPMVTFGRDQVRKELIAQSTLTGMVNGLNATQTLVRDTLAGELRIKFTNMGISDMLVWTLQGAWQIPHKRWIIQIDRPERLCVPDVGIDVAAWNRRNLFCYEYCVPLSHSDFRKQVARDIERLFGIGIALEQRKVDCLILRRISDTKNLMVTDEKGTMAKRISFLLDQRKELPPVLDELPPDHRYLLDVEVLKKGTYSDICNELARHGLRLFPEKRELSYLIFNQL